MSKNNPKKNPKNSPKKNSKSNPKANPKGGPKKTSKKPFKKGSKKPSEKSQIQESPTLPPELFSGELLEEEMLELLEGPCPCESGLPLKDCCFPKKIDEFEQEATLEEALEVPQDSTKTWEAGVYKLDTWFSSEEDEKPFRPQFVSWCDREKNIRYASSIFDPQNPKNTLEKSLFSAIVDPENGPPHRPQKILINQDLLEKHLGESAKALKISLEQVEKTPHVQDAQVFLQESMHPDSRVWPSLIESENLIPSHFEELTELAVQYFLKEPWRVFKEDVGFQLTWGEEKVFGMVMGSQHEEYGLSLCSLQKDLESCAQGRLRRGGKGQTLLLFGDQTISGFRDLDAWEARKFPRKDAYFTVAFAADEESDPRALNQQELEVFEIALRALPKLSEELGSSEVVQDASISVNIFFQDQDLSIHLECFSLALQNG